MQYPHQEEVKPMWAKPSELPSIFLGLGKQQCSKYVAEMYQHPDFSDDVIKPTQKTTIVNVERFKDWLKHMESEVYK